MCIYAGKKRRATFFSNPLKNRPPFFFKGGTSPSKAFGIIERFSEDIDLIIDRRHFGFENENDISASVSKSARQKPMNSLSDAISEYVVHPLLPTMERMTRDLLGNQGYWKIDPLRSETLLFHYPSAVGGHSYIAPVVRIEIGGNADSCQRRIVPFFRTSRKNLLKRLMLKSSQ